MIAFLPPYDPWQLTAAFVPARARGTWESGVWGMPAAWPAALPQTFLAEQPLSAPAGAACTGLLGLGGQHALGPAEVCVEDAAGECRRAPDGFEPGVGFRTTPHRRGACTRVLTQARHTRRPACKLAARRFVDPPTRAPAPVLCQPSVAPELAPLLRVGATRDTAAFGWASRHRLRAGRYEWKSSEAAARSAAGLATAPGGSRSPPGVKFGGEELRRDVRVETRISCPGWAARSRRTALA